MDTTLLLLRHAVTDLHARQAVIARQDPPLSADGETEAAALARACRDLPVGRVLTSPRIRASRTAEVVAAPWGRVPEVDPRIDDFDVGEWQGLSSKELEAREDFRLFREDPLSHAPPGGERLRDLADRTSAAAAEAVRSVGPGGMAAMVSHADVIRVLLVLALGVPAVAFLRLRVDTASLSAIHYSAGRPSRVIAVNWRARSLIAGAEGGAVVGAGPGISALL